MDQPGREHDSNFADYVVQLDGKTTARFEQSLLNGVMVLDHPGIISRTSTDEGLYFPLDEAGKPEQKQATIRLIPYYAYANRRLCRNAGLDSVHPGLT